MTKLPRIIGIAGHARNGKSTVASILVDRGYKEVSVAEQVWKYALQVNPWVPRRSKSALEHFERLSTLVDREGRENAKLNIDVRQLLQRIADAARDVIGLDAWIEAIVKENPGIYHDGLYVHSSLRQVRDAEWIHRLGGEVWRVKRYLTDGGETSAYYATDPSVPSEREVDVLYADLEIINDKSRFDLIDKVEKYISDRVLAAEAEARSRESESVVRQVR